VHFSDCSAYSFSADSRIVGMKTYEIAEGIFQSISSKYPMVVSISCTGIFYLLLEQVLRQTDRKIVVVSPVGKKAIKLANLFFGYLKVFDVFKAPRIRYPFEQLVTQGRIVIFEELCPSMVEECRNNAMVFVTPGWKEEIKNSLDLYHDCDYMRLIHCQSDTKSNTVNNFEGVLAAFIEASLANRLMLTCDTNTILSLASFGIAQKSGRIFIIEHSFYPSHSTLKSTLSHRPLDFVSVLKNLVKVLIYMYLSIVLTI